MPSQVWLTTRPTTTAAGRARYALVAALYKQQLGAVIAGRREALGLTQKELAERAHVKESQTVSRWERGERAPNDLEAVAAALETTVPEMLAGLEPLSQRRRKAMNATGSGSQLDRIEAQLGRLEAAVGMLTSQTGRERVAQATGSAVARSQRRRAADREDPPDRQAGGQAS